jgi:hypothetical protein
MTQSLYAHMNKGNKKRDIKCMWLLVLMILQKERTDTGKRWDNFRSKSG